MTEKNYLTIQGFMRTKLNLKGNELLVYALIYGFSQDGKSWFTGSANYISEWVGITRQNVMAILKRLVEKELIIKQDKVVNGVKLVDYKVNTEMYENNTPCNKTLHPCNETLHQNKNDTYIKETVSKDTEKKAEEIEIENAIISYTGNEQVRSILREFVEYRRSKRSKMSFKAFNMLLNKLRGFTEEEQIDAIETAMISNWDGVFPKHTYKKQEPVQEKHNVAHKPSEYEDFDIKEYYKGLRK